MGSSTAERDSSRHRIQGSPQAPPIARAMPVEKSAGTPVSATAETASELQIRSARIASNSGTYFLFLECLYRHSPLGSRTTTIARSQSRERRLRRLRCDDWNAEQRFPMKTSCEWGARGDQAAVSEQRRGVLAPAKTNTPVSSHLSTSPAGLIRAYFLVILGARFPGWSGRFPPLSARVGPHSLSRLTGVASAKSLRGKGIFEK